MINMGSKIKSLRKESGLSQTELAQKLNTSQDTVSLWELNRSCPDAENIVKLCILFDVSSDYLLGLKEY
ncbi:MAG: helix-turn-helix domain-containing protein [Clostridia bacterium]|nr:helix-turn-helix domain-containing protein [Clostridia bacterium]